MAEKELTKLNERKSLTQRICDLPDKREELHKKGYSDEEIKNMEKDSGLVDAEASAERDRMIELINYKYKQ